MDDSTNHELNRNNTPKTNDEVNGMTNKRDAKRQRNTKVEPFDIQRFLNKEDHIT